MADRARGRLARHAVVTGGSSGIGLALAGALARRGAAVALVARDARRLEGAAEGLRAAHPGAAISAHAADIRDARAAAEALAAAEAAHGPVDLAVACAGGARAGGFHDLPPEVFRELMELNYFGALNTLRPALAGMRARGAGRALIIGSAAGLAGIHGYSAYAPTKFALRGLAEALRAEHAPLGVQVAIAHPPDTETPQLAAERAERPAETAALAGTAGALAPEAVAEAILRGLARGRFDIPVGGTAWALLRLAPAARPLVDRWLDRRAARARSRG